MKPTDVSVFLLPLYLPRKYKHQAHHKEAGTTNGTSTETHAAPPFSLKSAKKFHTVGFSVGNEVVPQAGHTVHI